MFGYLPPHPGNPPTKKPLLTLLKQARAFGLGLILATQNPVDLDYKALSNAGTWFIGRMQADQDKQRLLDGLEGVQVGRGGTSRAEFDRMISAVQSRVFLLHNVHQDEPVVFHTRWAMSYLRGPLTRTQIQALVSKQPVPVSTPAAAAIPVASTPSGPTTPSLPAEPPKLDLPYSKVPPQLPSAVEQVFLPARIPLRDALDALAREQRWPARSIEGQEGFLVYEPALLGMARLRFPHTKSRQTHTEEVAYLLPGEDDIGARDWSEGAVKLEADSLERRPESTPYFAELPAELGAARSLSALEKEFEDFLYYNSSITLLYNPHLKLYSEPEESADAFQRRCRKAAEAARDDQAKTLRAKYESKLEQIEKRLEGEKRELEEDKVEHSARKQEELLSGVESVFGLLGGRRSSRRLSSASRRRRMTRQAKADIEESEEAIEDMLEEIEELKEEAKAEMQELTDQWAAFIDEVEEEEVRPRRADVQVSLFALAWVPRWEIMAAGQVLSMPAVELGPA
jgi:hypothetical protein